MEITVTITPKTAGPITQHPQPAASTPRNTQKFTAHVANDPANAGVTWAIAQGGGAIDSTGTFFPPLNPGKSTISATSVTDKTKSDTATVAYN